MVGCCCKALSQHSSSTSVERPENSEMVHAAENRTQYSGIRNLCTVVFECFKRSVIKFPGAAATETSIFRASCRLLSITRHEIESDIRLLRDHAMERDPRLQSGGQLT